MSIGTRSFETELRGRTPRARELHASWRSMSEKLARRDSERAPERSGITQRPGHLVHRGQNCFELWSRNTAETRSAGNVVSRERFKLVYNTSETVSGTVRSGHGGETGRRPDVP